MAGIGLNAPTHFGVTAFVYLAQFLMLGAATPAEASNPFDAAANFIAFTAVEGLPIWVSFALFAILTLPTLFLVASYVFELFGSELGTAAALLILGAATLFGFIGFT